MLVNHNPAELADGFRSAIAHFSTGVAVITTQTDEGMSGMTASAVASLSLDPLQLLVCIGSGLPTLAAISRARRFAVNVLGSDSEHLARHFARRQPDKFAGVALRTEYDVPVLDGAIAYFVCDVADLLPGGDHTIIVGEVLDCDHRPDAEPLVYFSRRFSRLDSPRDHARREFERYLDYAM